MFIVMLLGATYSFAAAAIDCWTKPEMSGKSSTLGKARDMGIADASTLGTPISVNVRLRMYGACETIWQRMRTVHTTLSSATQIGTGIWNQSCCRRV